MHELHLTAADKAARYAQILPQLRAIIEDESDTVANLANTAACSSRSQSEIVVPLRDASGAVWAVLDADAEALAVFDETDAQGLETIAVWLSEKHGVIV